MKVTSLLLVLCIAACVYAQTSCPIRRCAKAQEQCGSTANNTQTYCGADSICTVSASGSDVGVCQIPFKLGDTCDGSNCESGTDCILSGDNRICALNPLPTSYLYPGEGCNDDKQCQYNSPYGGDDAADLCRGGKCKSIKTGDYCSVPAGSSSNTRLQCNYNNAYCGRTRQCTKYIKRGDACYFGDATEYGCGKPYDSACVPNGVNSDVGTCQKLHSRKVGEFCGSIDHCKEGLFCRTRPSDSYGICTEVTDTATLNKECPLLGCNSDNQETCRCGSEDGIARCYATVRPDGYHEANRDLQECSRKKGCAGNFNCIKDKCKSQRCKMNKVNKKTPYNSLDCVAEGLCNSAFTLVASPVLALVAFVVIFAL